MTADDGERPAELTEDVPPGPGLAPVYLRAKPPPHPDTTRWRVTAWLLSLVSAVIASAMVAVAFGRLPAETALQLIFPPVLSAVATAVGFYFGSHRSGGPDER